MNERTRMPIAMLMEIPGCTQQQYDDVMAELRLEGMPAGGICHVAAPMEGGWRVLDVWESQEQFDRFYEDKLHGALVKANIRMDNPPKFAPVHNVMSIDRAPATSPVV
jgi:hypothetical protein